MADTSTTGGKVRFRIDRSEDPVQNIAPFNESQRFEGVAFSPSGDVLAVVASDADTVLLFKRMENGRFEDAPFSFITGAASGINYPHDASFSDLGDSQLLAVAQRRGAISIFERPKPEPHFRRKPAFEILGAEARLSHSDAVAFIPSDNAQLAVCNLTNNTVSFYRRTSSSPIRFGLEPVFVLEHDSLCGPDGLTFSSCGRWLAIANHGDHTVSIFQRSSDSKDGHALRYEPEPVSVIAHPSLRHPHSVVFTPRTHHLVITSAGTNYFSVHEPTGPPHARVWSNAPVIQETVGSESIFREMNAQNKMEGGPKGIAIHDNTLAVCSPQYGVTIYTFREYD
ncbi:MAG TPA: hypothetical protein VGO43_15990 [Pyrinomonadaceae bacterium]|jgi:WD40 repeat protein|nr:hypothetical protein [Pyrinomonadaceae bacterium]